MAAESNIKIYTRLDEIEQLRTFWEKNSNHPNADLDFYLNIIKTGKNIISPIVIVIEKDYEVVNIVAGRIERERIDCKIGYNRLWTPRCTVLVVIYGGLLGFFDEEIIAKLVSLFPSLMHKYDIDVANWHMLNCNSDIARILSCNWPRIFFQKSHKIQSHWRLKLPDSYQILIGRIKKKHRYWLRRQEKLLKNDFSGNVTVKQFSKPAEVVTFVEHAELIAIETYHRALGVGFKDNEQMRSRLMLLAQKQRMYAWIMYIEEKPVSFWLGTLYNGIFHLGYTGYLPALKKYEVGSLLFQKMMESLIEKKISYVDFGFGNAFYKSRMADEVWNECNYFLFTKNFKGFLVNTYISLLFLIDYQLRWVVKKIGAFEQIKTFFRRISIE